jgi:hypothetical protein
VVFHGATQGSPGSRKCPSTFRQRGVTSYPVRAAERRVGADEVCDGKGCRSPRSSTLVFCGPIAVRTDVLKYIELASGSGHNGPAWIARVQTSRSGRTLYFNGRALKRAIGGGVVGNHFDLQSGEEYWVSGVNRAGSNRHWAGSGPVMIEESAVKEYLELTGRKRLSPSEFTVIPDLPESLPTDFAHLEHSAMGELGEDT